MKKRKSNVLRVSERVNRAVGAGFSIPLLSIPEVYKALEAAILEGKSDAELIAIVAATEGVVKL